MEDEKLLAPGERFVPPIVPLNKPAAAPAQPSAVVPPVAKQVPQPAPAPAPVSPTPPPAPAIVPPVANKMPASVPANLPGVPSPKQQQWGVIISIVIIVLMIVVGAFYAWGKRIAQNQYPGAVTQ